MMVQQVQGLNACSPNLFAKLLLKDGSIQNSLEMHHERLHNPTKMKNLVSIEKIVEQ